MATTSSYSVGILTISDRCSRGEAEDKSGPKLVSIVSREKKILYNTNRYIHYLAIFENYFFTSKGRNHQRIV